jgi:hypothetical protein
VNWWFRIWYVFSSKRVELLQKTNDCQEPFAARLDIEVINTPSPVKSSRNNEDLYQEGK